MLTANDVFVFAFGAIMQPCRDEPPSSSAGRESMFAAIGAQWHGSPRRHLQHEPWHEQHEQHVPVAASDLDNDGAVDVVDLLMLLGAFDTAGGDVNADGYSSQEQLMTPFPNPASPRTLTQTHKHTMAPCLQQWQARPT